MEDTVDSVEDAPSSKITINYPSGKTVEFGKELTPTEVKDEPQVSWDADTSKYYTFLMYDPDAPTREDPNLADIKHWLVVNIKGCDLSTGEVLADYVGSLPRKGHGLHRYIFLVFEQKGKIVFDEAEAVKDERKNRLKWSVREFRRKYGLETAYAGNYYQAQWEPYVDDKRKELGVDKN